MKTKIILSVLFLFAFQLYSFRTNFSDEMVELQFMKKCPALIVPNASVLRTQFKSACLDVFQVEKDFRSASFYHWLLELCDLSGRTTTVAKIAGRVHQALSRGYLCDTSDDPLLKQKLKMLKRKVVQALVGDSNSTQQFLRGFWTVNDSHCKKSERIVIASALKNLYCKVHSRTYSHRFTVAPTGLLG